MIIENIMRNALIICIAVLVVACGGAEERKAKYMQKGKEYFEAGNMDKARVEFKNVTQIDPKFSEAFYYVGRLEEREKNIGKAIANYNKAIELNPQYLAPKISLAKIFVVVGTPDYIERSRTLLAEVLASDKSNVDARLIKATIEYKTGDKEKALREIEKVIAEDDSLVEGISLLATVYADQGAKKKAIALLEKGVRNNTSAIPLRISLAKLYASENEIEKAEQQILEVTQLEPDVFSYRVALFSLYSSSGQMEKAEQVLRKAIEDDREDINRYLLLVEYVSRKKSIGEAEELLKAQVKDNPAMIELRFALAEFYEKINRHEMAIDVLKKIIENNDYEKDEIGAKVQLASIYLDKKNYDAARKYVEEVLEDSPRNNDALLIRGKLALAYRNGTDAINDLRTVFNEDPRNPEAAMLLSGAYDAEGQKSLAEDVLKKSIENNPTNYKTHYNYIRYLINNKRMDEAESILDKAVDYFKESYELMELKAALLSQSGNEAAFVAFLDKMKTAFPDNADVYLKKGQYYLAKKQYTAARSELEQAMKYSTEPYRPLKMIIDSYLVEGNAQHATDRLNSRLTQDGNDAMALQLLGRVKFSEKQIEEAREKFIQAINARKGWLVPYLNLASTYLSESNTARAIEIYHQAIENVDNASPARLQLASIYEKQGKRGDAISQYKEILKEEPTHLLVANNLASLMMDDNPGPADIDLALDLTKSFAKMQQPAFLDTLGWVYVKAGRYPEAVSVLRQAVDKAPNVAVFKYHLGVALNSDGKADEARKYLLEAVNSEQDFIGKNEASKLVGS